MHAWSLLSDGFFLSLSLCLDIGIANVAIISLTLSHGFKPGLCSGLAPVSAICSTPRLLSRAWRRCCNSSAVRWVVWIGGAIVLLFLTWKMAREALYPASAPPVEGEADLATPRPSHAASFLRGALLAVSSPSAILWFAAVGGALIAKAGATSRDQRVGVSQRLLLSADSAGRSLSARSRATAANAQADGLLRVCHVLSALLFAYFSYSVIVNGYHDLIVKTHAGRSVRGRLMPPRVVRHPGA